MIDEGRRRRRQPEEKEEEEEEHTGVHVLCPVCCTVPYVYHVVDRHHQAIYICIYTRKLMTVPLTIIDYYYYYSTAVGGQNHLVHTQVMITYRTPTEKTEKEEEEEEEVVVVGHETGHECTYIQYMRRDTSIHTFST
jgi:hypothetical protein